MKTFILTKKKITFDKNKEYTFQIPLTLDVDKYELIIDTLKLNSNNQQFTITFKLFKNSNLIIKEFDINQNYQIINVNNINHPIGDCTILSCKCSEDVEIALSVVMQKKIFELFI